MILAESYSWLFLGLLKLGLYGIYVAANAAVMETAPQMVEASDFTHLLLGISVGAFIVNVAAFMWEFTLTRAIENDCWKILVFKTIFYFTAILSPYSAVSMLFPKKFMWYLFGTICMTMIGLIIFFFKNKLRASLTLACEKVVDAARCMRSFMTTDDQVLPATNAATARIAAEEEEQNLGGSRSSTNLPWLSATGPAASQEQLSLNGFTSVPL